MFDNFVSLGSACPVAASMAKYGLRSWSGPFDWLITMNLGWVLHYIENNFEDFLLYENIEEYNELKHFREIASDFMFVHEEQPIAKTYNLVKAKYQRRIDRFIEKTKKPTCFLRAVLDENEVEFIIENALYISQVIKKQNKYNEIIFLVKEGIEIQNIPFHSYSMSAEWGGGSRDILRGWFDGAYEFLEYCAKQYSSPSLMRNLIFDNNSTEISAGYNIEYNTRNIWKERYDILIKLLNFDFSTIDWPNEICIYGCGNIGANFYEKIKDFTVVRYFIDRRWCKKGGFNGIPVLSPENTSLINNQKVIVTATYDYDNICKSIKQTAPNADVISVLELMQ